MAKKIGVYICEGCKIGESLNIDNLTKADRSASICKTHPFLCNEDGIETINNDINTQGIDSVVIAGCSGRVNQDIFCFGETIIVERVNLREQVIWCQESNNEDTQMMSEDYLKMGIVKAQKMELPTPYLIENSNKSIMVVGGGITGLTSAIEAANAGYEVVLVEKESQLGGYTAKLHKQLPQNPPYQEIEESDINIRTSEVLSNPRIKVLTSSNIIKTSGQPGNFEVIIKTFSKNTETTFTVGAIVLATGFQPYDATKLEHLGFGKYQNVITNVQMEELAKKGRITRPSDGKEAKSIAFIQCAGSRDKEHLPYCSSFCCMTSLKQAMYIRQQNQDSLAYIFYKDMRTPGQYENFYKKVQEDEGIFLTKGEITQIEATSNNNLVVSVKNTLILEDIAVEVDMVVLACGIVPTTSIERITPQSTTASREQSDVPPDTIIKSDILNLNYRQGPELPALRYGFPDSHFICFPYETRRTGIYAAGCVRAPMNISTSVQDATGAALKAIQCVELTSQGKAMHPRALDMSYPSLFMQRCTQCKRCTEECPFGAYNEDEKCNPLPNPARCRRCGTCLGSCPERIISFSNYSIDIIASMIKAIDVPEEDENKPRILAFVYENDAYPALDIVGLKRLKYNTSIRIIPLRCAGSLNLVWISDALSKGFDGVLVIGCKHGDDYQCHFVKGSELANYRLTKIQETLNRLALESERVQMYQLALSEYEKLPGIFNNFMEIIDKIGPNPFKGF